MQRWERGYDLAFMEAPAKQHKRPYFDEAKARVEAMRSCEGGRFTCPNCGVSFSVKLWGVWGRMKVFEAPTHYCKDCAHEECFTKER